MLDVTGGKSDRRDRDASFTGRTHSGTRSHAERVTPRSEQRVYYNHERLGTEEGMIKELKDMEMTRERGEERHWLRRPNLSVNRVFTLSHP